MNLPKIAFASAASAVLAMAVLPATTGTAEAGKRYWNGHGYSKHWKGHGHYGHYYGRGWYGGPRVVVGGYYPYYGAYGGYYGYYGPRCYWKPKANGSKYICR
ncbi:hypothetical protein [Prosthecomicrobium sp. N25]|uniref:hypothetical protein n=1 Tax=Prosthecomicrobium sp. N25 TaxID=3129254 RepID=UPI003078A5F9